MICSMTDLILDNVVCYNRLLYICDIGFYPGLDFGLGLDSRGRGQTLEAEAEAEAKTLEAEAEAGFFGLEAEARPRGLTSPIAVHWLAMSLYTLIICSVLNYDCSIHGI